MSNSAKTTLIQPRSAVAQIQTVANGWVRPSDVITPPAK
jgi:hypothetical protein